MKIAIGFASGLGNCVMMLPAVKAIKLLGHRISLYVQTDFPTADLWRRCIYVDEIIKSPAALNGHRLICGNWVPADWKRLGGVSRYPLPQIHFSEWRSNMKAAEALGWKGDVPDISDWCRDLDRSPSWDMGIVPGCKGGTWIRKRYPGMADVARQFLEAGRKVAVFGKEEDGVRDIPGEPVDTRKITDLPEALAGCRVVIGTESGVTHLASSLGVPTVMVYTATSEQKSEPVCKPNRQVMKSLPCRPCVSLPRWQACANWKCRDIDPVDVICAAEQLLE